jgi:hypothetical protein
MDFPAEWEVFASADFETAESRRPGGQSVELMAQMRPNGRVLDHWRFAVGGNAALDIDVMLEQIIPGPAAFPHGWRYKTQFWPRDVAIRRNMTTGGWQDVYENLAARQAQVVDVADILVPTEDVVAYLEGLPQAAVKSASLRWAVVVGETGSLQLDLQSLPATSRMLSGKPAFRG